MEVPLKFKFSVDGNNQVKSVMNDLNNALQRGQISNIEYADSLQKIAREQTKVTNAGRYQNQIFLAMHPNINKMSRAFSTFASVARTTMSLMTTINTLLIAQNTKSSALSDVTSQLAEKYRELNRTQDPEKRQQLIEDISTLKAKQDELKNQDNITYWEGWLTAILGVGLYLNIVKNHLGKIFNSLGKLKGLGAGGIFSAIAIGMALAVEELYKFLFGIEDMDKWREENQQKLVEFFTVVIPTAIGQAGAFISNFFLNDLPTWAQQSWDVVVKTTIKTWNDIVGFVESGINGIIKGFSDFVNMIISGFNTIINGMNNIPGISIPLIPQFKMEGISLPRISTENTTGVKSSVGVGTGIQNNITIMGSILSERELVTVVDKYTKQTYKSNGLSVN